MQIVQLHSVLLRNPTVESGEREEKPIRHNITDDAAMLRECRCHC